MKLQLYYDGLLVADIPSPFLHQGTWFGEFRQVVSDQSGPIAVRIREFIDFCRECHVRVHAGSNCAASEFDRFSDLLRSGLWLTRDDTGMACKIEEAPVFSNGDISWRLQTVQSAV